MCVQMPHWCQDPCFNSSHLPAFEHLGCERVSTDLTCCLCVGVLCRGETWPVLQFRCWRMEQEWKYMPRGLSLLAMSRPPHACPARQKCMFTDLSLMSSLFTIYEYVKSVNICAGMDIHTQKPQADSRHLTLSLSVLLFLYFQDRVSYLALAVWEHT